MQMLHANFPFFLYGEFRRTIVVRIRNVKFILTATVFLYIPGTTSDLSIIASHASCLLLLKYYNCMWFGSPGGWSRSAVGKSKDGSKGGRAVADPPLFTKRENERQTRALPRQKREWYISRIRNYMYVCSNFVVRFNNKGAWPKVSRAITLAIFFTHPPPLWTILHSPLNSLGGWGLWSQLFVILVPYQTRNAGYATGQRDSKCYCKEAISRHSSSSQTVSQTVSFDTVWLRESIVKVVPHVQEEIKGKENRAVLAGGM